MRKIYCSVLLIYIVFLLSCDFFVNLNAEKVEVLIEFGYIAECTDPGCIGSSIGNRVVLLCNPLPVHPINLIKAVDFGNYTYYSTTTGNDGYAYHWHENFPPPKEYGYYAFDLDMYDDAGPKSVNINTSVNLGIDYTYSGMMYFEEKKAYRFFFHPSQKKQVPIYSDFSELPRNGMTASSSDIFYK